MQFVPASGVSNAKTFYRFSPKTTKNTARRFSYIRFPCQIRYSLSSTPFLRGLIFCKADPSEMGSSAPMSKILSRESSLELSSLTALSPLNGRYWNKVKDLAPYLSVFGLIHFRILLQIKWLIKLSEIPQVKEVPPFTRESRSYLKEISDNFTTTDAMEVKNFEDLTNHDGVEYFLKKKCQSNLEIIKVFQSCPSFNLIDIENIAHGLMLKEAVDKVLLPSMQELITAIYGMLGDNSHILMPSTQLQTIASSITYGDLIEEYVSRLAKIMHNISQIEIVASAGQTSGSVAYPDINMPHIANEFVTSFGLAVDPYIPQKDSMVDIYLKIATFNDVLIEFDQVVWDYISLGFFKQITIDGEIGSSTMPHKVNPINFENSEGNLGMARSGLYHLASHSLSRSLCDLIQLAVGTVLGHSLIGYKSTMEGIAKLQVDETCIKE